MRVIKKQKRAPDCPTCGAIGKVTQHETYGCDECGKEIGDSAKGIGTNRLDVTVFRQNGDNVEHLYFCSWSCVFKALPKIKSDYFVDLPMLLYDRNAKGCNASDFFKELKRRTQ